MKSILKLSTLAVLTAASPLLVGAAETAVQPNQRIILFDGKSFQGWFRFLRNGQGNVDETWTIKPDGILACTGKPAGYIRTEKAYRNYILHLEYRWAGRPGNNGVLVHMVGEDKVWPKSLECQGAFQNNGDFFEIGGFEFKEHKAGGPRVKGRRVIKSAEPNEKPPGEWNVYEVHCIGQIVRPIVNGRRMNEATECSPSEGKICLQSEGVPIEFRNIYLEPVLE